MITVTSGRDLISRSSSRLSSWPSRRSRITRFGSSRTSKPATSSRLEARDGPDVVLRKIVHHQVPHGVVVFDNKTCRLSALGTNPLARCVKRLESVSTGATRSTARRFVFYIGIFGSPLSAAEARFHMTYIIFHLRFTIERSGYR